ncbi:ABC transporter permease [Metaclostridioides mangenotii]|uniref:ABC transport system permease protein n=1 Tax=Metaclostridioides mangenotii TaxID=1540 RepID=A0ABS4EC32_9FIRM|nr:FtsX-like permease family protein [Clostridioides mangenotii]MBP1855489.1 putative ABC transport system permease protein [Clostridioides mangenotii]
MNVFSIAFNNFRSNIRTYAAFFISMVFSVVVLINFEILKNSETIKFLQGENKKFTEAVLISVIVILSVFLVFFIWYATNVFFKNRVKEIGILSFMGLDLFTIGKIYFVENMLIGVSSFISGLAIGVVSSRFFQVIIVKISGFDIDVSSKFGLNALVSSAVLFLSIFLIMTLKGFITICRSSVISLMNMAKQEEKIPKVGLLLYIMAIVSLMIIGYGYYLSFDIRSGNIGKIVPIIIIICIGTYGLFKSVIPVVFSVLMKNKKILFNGENIISISNINYRLSKNYKTYAVISIIITATISTLGSAVAIKDIQENAAVQRNIYTVSAVSSDKNVVDRYRLENIIRQTNDIKYSVNPEMIVVEKKNNKYIGDIGNIFMNYRDFVKILKDNGNEEAIKELGPKFVNGKNIIQLKSPQMIGSVAEKVETVDVDGFTYKISKGEVKTPVLGTGFSYEIYIVNNSEYQKLREKGKQLYFYGAKVENEKNSQAMFNNLKKDLKTKNIFSVQNGYKVQEESQWMKFAYAVLVFLFIVFIMVAGSIIYMKIYNDAYEDRDKYDILIKVGASEGEIKKSIVKEVSLFYSLPIISAAISSYFALRLVGDILITLENVFSIYILSLVVCFLIFLIYGVVSVSKFKKIIGIK